MQKVSDASGSKYSSGGPTASNLGGPPPPTSSKPAFTPTQSSRGAGSFRSSASSRLPAGAKEPVDEDGWGQDAPPVTRTELEKVQSSYQPTKVNLHDISSQKPQPSIFNGAKPENDVHEDVVKGAYQPVGKVDIAALRRQAQESGRVNDDRPSAVKGSYEPVGKVDIAAIRAKAQQPSGVAPSPPGSISPAATGASVQSSNRGGQNSSTPAHTSERLTSLPKPKVGGKFGAGANTFAGTKAPTPGEFGLESKPTPAAPPVGVGRTFADQGGKTPAQLWAEKKARERGASAAGDHLPPAGFGPPSSPIASQTSGGGDWKSGYKGKSWAPVQTTRTGQSASSMSEKATTEEEQSHEAVPSSPAGGIGAIRDRFKDTSPMGVAPEGVGHAAPGPPALDTSNKPNATRGVPIPGLPTRPLEKGPEENRMPTPPAQPPRSPTPPTPPALDPGSPIRVAMPVSRGQEPKHEVNDAREEQFSPPPAMPTRSLAQQIPHDTELTEEPSGHDPARAAGAAAAAASFGQQAADSAQPGVDESGKRALVQFDYEKAEDNELELREGEYVTNIEMVDEDWWMGQNPRGETGLFPSNYVELVEDTGDDTAPGGTHHLASEPDEEPIKHTENTAVDSGHTATALYDYEAAEDNELSFPEHAKITGIVRLTHRSSFQRSLTSPTRSFLMMIGGPASIRDVKVCFRQIMCN